MRNHMGTPAGRDAALSLILVGVLAIIISAIAFASNSRIWAGVTLLLGIYMITGGVRHYRRVAERLFKNDSPTKESSRSNARRP
jgi:hypothetical protein